MAARLKPKPKFLVRPVFFNKKTGQPSITLPKKKLSDFFHGKKIKKVKLKLVRY